MYRHARWSSLVSTALMLALLGSLWVMFAPVQVGGHTAYIIVMGNSMEPTYHRGDLVLVRQAPQYVVGDVVTYHHPEIGPVIHRIIALDHDRFVFKGDNNAWTDSYRPTADELIGKRWLHLAGAGRIVEQLRRPWAVAVLAVALGYLVIGMALGIDKRRPQERPARRSATPARGLGAAADSALALLAVVACAALVVAGIAFARPITREVADDVAYQALGEFSYSASAPAGVYDGAAAETGDPIFPQLSPAVDVAFDYRLTGAATPAVDGTARLVAELGDASGWKRTIELAPERAFSGSAVRIAGVLDLARVQQLIATFEQRTAAPRQQYTLAIVPEIVVQGTLAGQPLRNTFSPRLELRLDQHQLHVAGAANGVDPFRPVQPGVLTHSHSAPNSVSLLGIKLDIAATRRLALLVGGSALAGLVALGLRAARVAGRDEAARLRLRYGAQLIDVRAAQLGPSARTVEVATLDDLARIAESQGRMILRVVQGAAPCYLVQADGVAYCYTPAGAPPEAPPAAEVEAGWQPIFLDHLRAMGTVGEACQAAGVSLTAVYRERERDPQFERALVAARTGARPPHIGVERW